MASFGSELRSELPEEGVTIALYGLKKNYCFGEGDFVLPRWKRGKARLYWVSKIMINPNTPNDHFRKRERRCAGQP